MKKVKITILTNPLLISAEKIEYFIVNTCKGLGSIDRKKYKIDLHLLFWNALPNPKHYFMYLGFDDFTVDNEKNKNYSDVYSIYNKITDFENIKNINIGKMIDVAKENIAKYPDTFSVSHLDNISYDFIELDNKETNYGAWYQFCVLTEDVRNSFDYDLYIYTSSNNRLSQNTEYFHEWIVNYEKYPKLPLYLNSNSWRYAGDSHSMDTNESFSTNVDRWAVTKDLKINDSTILMFVGTAHNIAVRPQKFINFIEKDLFDDGILEYIRTDVEKIHIGSVVHETVINGDQWSGDGIKIKNVREVEQIYPRTLRVKDFKDKFPYVAGMEPGPEFIIHFFQIYMIKYGFKKFDIPFVDFGCIKIPISSLDNSDETLTPIRPLDPFKYSYTLRDETPISFDQIHELPNLIMTITNKIFEEIGISHDDINNFIDVTSNICKKHNECFGDDISLEEFEEFRSESYDTFFERVSLIYSEIKNIYEDKYEKNI